METCQRRLQWEKHIQDTKIEKNGGTVGKQKRTRGWCEIALAVRKTWMFPGDKWLTWSIDHHMGIWSSWEGSVLSLWVVIGGKGSRSDTKEFYFCEHPSNMSFEIIWIISWKKAALTLFPFCGGSVFERFTMRFPINSGQYPKEVIFVSHISLILFSFVSGIQIKLKIPIIYI